MASDAERIASWTSEVDRALRRAGKFTDRGAFPRHKDTRKRNYELEEILDRLVKRAIESAGDPERNHELHPTTERVSPPA